MALQPPGSALGQPGTTLLPARALSLAQPRGDAPEHAPRLLAVDGTGLMVRCSRAARTRGSLSAPDGTPTAALTMFAGSLARKLRHVRPSHLVICWDGLQAGQWRRELWPGYKAGRDTAWRAFGPEMTQMTGFCAAAGMRQLIMTGFEADDLLASVCRAPGDLPVLLWTDDADLQQMLDDYSPDDRHPAVALDTMDRDEGAPITEAMTERFWGIHPSWLPEVRALAGDVSDGIPGLPRIGPKRAVRMIREGGMTWPLPETVLSDPEHRRLAGIWRDIMELLVPILTPEREAGLDLSCLAGEAGWDPQSAGNVRELLDRYGMSRIAERLEKGELW